MELNSGMEATLQVWDNGSDVKFDSGSDFRASKERGCVSPSGSQTLVSAFSVSAVYRWVNVKLYLKVFFITTD